MPPRTKFVPPGTFAPPRTFVPPRTLVPPRTFVSRRMTSCFSKEHTLCYVTDICTFLTKWNWCAENKEQLSRFLSRSLDQIWVHIYISFSILENLEQQLRMQLDASVGRISKGIRRLLLSCPLLMHWEIGKALCFRMSFSRLWLTDHVITRPPTTICFELQAQHCKQPD